MVTANDTPETLRVDLERIRHDILALAAIGIHPDDRGIYRMALSPADLAGRAWLRERLEKAGFQPRMDGAANLSARLDSGSSGPAVLVGSHIDTVPCAGALDGTLGVVAGMECLRRLKEAGWILGRPLELISFTDEEGRFGGMLGSEAFAGRMNPERIHQAVDADGVRLEDIMRERGLDPVRILEARRDPSTVDAYLELHIEQGPVLDELHKSVGLVESITGLFKWIVSLRGEANHAGTTPMKMRRDALMGLADFAHEIPRLLDENGSDQGRATIGKAEILPGSPNTVPGLVEFTVDARDTTHDSLHQLAEAFRRALQAIARRRGLSVEINEQSLIEPVRCDEAIVRALEARTARLNISAERMTSGAAHDAQIISAITRTAMIFVPSKQGKSHSPAEWTDWEDIEAGANLLLATLIDLTDARAPGTTPNQA